MTVTPRAQRRVKKTSGYKIPPDIEQDMNALVDSGEFANRADIHTAALRFWLTYRKFDIAKALREFLDTEAGREMIATAVRRRQKKK